MSIPYCFDYRTFRESFEVRQCECSNFIFSFSTFYFRLFEFLYIFLNVSQFQQKISARILIKMVLILALLRDFAIKVNSSSSKFRPRCFAKVPVLY